MEKYDMNAIKNLYNFLYPTLEYNYFNDYDGNKQEIVSMSKEMQLDCLSLGYIITKEGFVIPIEEGHGVTAISYLKKLLGSKWEDKKINSWDIELLKAKAIVYTPLEKSSLQYDSSWLPTEEIGTYLLYDHLFKLPKEQQRIIQKINCNMDRHQITPVYCVNYQFYDENEMIIVEQRQYYKSHK